MVLVLVWFGLGSDPGFGLGSGFSSGFDLGLSSSWVQVQVQVQVRVPVLVQVLIWVLALILGSGSDSRFDIQFATDGSGLILVRIVMPVCSIWLIRYASQPIR